MKHLIILLSIAGVLLSSCKKEKDPVIDQNTSPTPQGCVVQNILAYNLTQTYEYTYNTAIPSRLDAYKIRDASTGDVTHSYKLHYDQFLTTINQVDTVTHWYGDYDNGYQFSDKTLYRYHNDLNNHFTMDSAILYNYDPNEWNHISPKGTTYYNYNDGLLEGMEYVSYNITDFHDNYEIKYLYNAAGQMIEMDVYDYQDNLSYYEKHELTNYIQPNYLVIVNDQLSNANLYAPSKTIGYYTGTGTYTYNYLYQVNDKNYVIEQDQVLQSGDTSFLKLFNYKCY